jgi:hypothetical protein
MIAKEDRLQLVRIGLISSSALAAKGKTRSFWTGSKSVESSATGSLNNPYAAKILIDLRPRKYPLFNLAESIVLPLELVFGESGHRFGISQGHDRNSIGIGQHDVAGTDDNAATSNGRSHLATTVLIAPAG